MTVVIWILAVPVALGALSRLFGLERGWVPVCATAFVPYLAALSPVPLLAAALTGRWWAAAVTAASMVSLAVAVLPRALGRPEDGDGPVLRVLTANLLHGDADLDTVMGLVTGLDVDLLALQEYTPLVHKTLDAAGLRAILPEHCGEPRWGGTGAALYSRYPITAEPVRVNAGEYRNARAVLRVPGAPEVFVESAHPAAPWAAHQMDVWWAGQAGQPRASVDGPLRLLAGDFNATLDHAAFRRLVRSGYRDAASVVGRGLRHTWHHEDHSWLPGATLDHVLADRRIRVRAASVHEVPGSDHRALFAELILPRA